MSKLIFNGVPKICVPLTGATEDELISQAQNADAADLLEWRADYFSGEIQASTAEALKNVVGGKPLLFTFRTKKEGGGEIAPDQYAALIKKMSESVDLIDIELFSGDEMCLDLVEFAHKGGVEVIISNHDFEKTPPLDEITQRLFKMRELGADICKIAVMPQSPEDVLTLLSATNSVSQRIGCPIITMSMGKLGAVTRVYGALFGSCVTFGAVGKASAPGQLPADELKRVINTFR